MTTFGGVGLATSLQTAYSKLNYGVIDAQANIPDDWRSYSPTEQIQVPQKRIRSANESKAVFPWLHGVVEAIELAETGSKTTSEELKLKMFLGGGGGGGDPDPPSKCMLCTHIIFQYVPIGLSTFYLLPMGLQPTHSPCSIALGCSYSCRGRLHHYYRKITSLCTCSYPVYTYKAYCRASVKVYMYMYMCNMYRDFTSFLISIPPPPPSRLLVMTSV